MTCVIVGEPTHRAGNTLDLTWANIAGVRVWVERNEFVTSDHLPICDSVSSRTLTSVTNKEPLKYAKDKIPQFGLLVSQLIEPFNIISLKERIEHIMKSISTVLLSEIKAVGK